MQSKGWVQITGKGHVWTRIEAGGSDLPRLGGAAGAGMGYTMGTGTTLGSGCSITFSLSLSYACVGADSNVGFLPPR